MRSFGIVFLIGAGLAAFAQDSNLKKAEDLYQHTNYQASLELLKAAKPSTAAELGLIGRDYFMLGEFKQATDWFQKAAALEPAKSEWAHWLGRAWGRRAETASPLTAPLAASKARQYFEQAVALDPHNSEALDDLFDYYLQAPGFLGGGLDKAAATAQRIAALDPAEGHFAFAQL